MNKIRSVAVYLMILFLVLIIALIVIFPMGLIGRFIQTDGASVGDMYENNDTFSKAYDFGTDIFLTTYATLHDKKDLDYYTFTVSYETRVAINISDIPVECDYDLIVYDSDGNELGFSECRGESPENINLLFFPGKYTARVKSHMGYSDSEYTLRILTDVDEYEYNDDIENATFIGELG